MRPEPTPSAPAVRRTVKLRNYRAIQNPDLAGYGSSPRPLLGRPQGISSVGSASDARW